MTPTTLIRVLLADDHAIVRKGIREFLEEDGEIVVVAEASDGVEAVRLAGEHRPAVAVLDIQMPRMTGIEATRQIKAAYPDVRVLILTAYEDDPYVFALLRAGADGYILKSADPDDLVRAVKATAAGGTVLSPDIAAKVVAQMTSGMPAAAQEQVEPLSDRELDVLRLAAAGIDQQGHRRHAEHQRPHRPGASGEHLRQARRQLAHRGGDHGAQARLDRAGRQVAVLRQLRGLRVQLLLWTILPLAVVLVILSVAGVARHRQVMTQLVEDRDRGMTLAEANRLGREIDRRAALLARAAASLDNERMAGLDAGLLDAYAGGLALLDASGQSLASTEAAPWLDQPEARDGSRAHRGGRPAPVRAELRRRCRSSAAGRRAGRRGPRVGRRHSRRGARSRRKQLDEGG